MRTIWNPMTALLVLACGEPATSTEVPAEEAVLDWEGEWFVEWARPGGWRPFLFSGLLELRNGEQGWTPALSFLETKAAFSPTAVELDDDAARLVFGLQDGARLELDLFRDGDRLRGGAVWVGSDGEVEIPWSVVDGSRRWRAPIRDDVVSPWPVATPSEVGLDEALVQRLLTEGQRTHSSGLVVVKDGKLVVAAGDALDVPGPLTSVTKAVSSLAVPFLLAEGHWPSLDHPLGEAFEAWREDPRGAITLRQVLSHTTGLETPEYRAWFAEAGQDHRADVLSAKPIAEPGATFAYSNRTVEITSVLVQQRTGLALDAYLRPRLLDPIGAGGEWRHDPKGHALVHGGLAMTAMDLARIGVLLADDGRWSGEQVLPAGWVGEATGEPTAHGKRHVGLGWFVSGDGRVFEHTGDAGALLWVAPGERLVVARVHRRDRGDEGRRDPHALGPVLRQAHALLGD